MSLEALCPPTEKSSEILAPSFISILKSAGEMESKHRKNVIICV